MLHRLLVIVLCVFITACGTSKRPGALVPVGEIAPGAKMVDILVATTRTFDGATGEFGDGRSAQLGFQRIKLSIPPGHKAGEIEWPPQMPGNAAQHFVTVSNQTESKAAFLRSVEERVPASGEVIVFVHGYNTAHEEAIFRLGQLVADAGVQNLPIAFTWPSRGELKDYVTDRESSLAARNRLEELLEMLSRSPKIKGINVMAHSMGGMLLMETLVQAKLKGNGEFGGKLDAVVLASPDIDVDVFLSQFEIIGKRARPTIILVSRDDKALRISRRIAGDVVRVGAASATDPRSVAAIKKYGFTVIDLTDTQTGDSTNHTKFAHSPKFLQAMGATINSGLSRAGNPVGSLIADTAGAILEAPSNIVRQVAQ